MMREHVVETLEWEVAFASEHEAFDWQERLVSLMRGPAVEIIGEVFDEIGGGAREVLSLDTLTVDLGKLPRAGFEEHLRDRLRASLRDALQQEVGALRLQSAQHGGEAAARADIANGAPARRTDLLLQYLARGFLSWRAGKATRQRLDQLAEAMARDDGAQLQAWLRDAPPGARPRLAALLRRHTAAMRERLAELLLADGPPGAADRDAWAQLLQWDTEGLLAQVRHHGQAARVRRQMARHFTSAMLLDLVGLLVPAERDFIESVVGRPALFGAAMDPQVPPARMQPRLWEFTLAYLLVDRGSEFNRRSYIASLLRRNARQDGMDYAQLVLALIASVEAAGLPAGLAREMLQLLRTLTDPFALSLSKGIARASTGSARTDGAEAPNDPFTPPNDPFALSLSKGGARASTGSARTDGDEASNDPFAPPHDPFAPPNDPFALSLSKGIPGTSTGSARTGEAEAPNDPFAPPNDPFALSLSKGGARASTGSARTGEGSARTDDSDEAVIAFGWMKLRVEAAFLHDGGIDTRVRAGWTALVAEDPEWLVAQALRHGQAERVRQRMARGFGTPMLLQLVALLLPTEHDFVETVVDRSALFGEAMDPPVGAREMQPRLWEFTLAYLLVERGSEFNRRSYLASVLRRVAAQAGMDYGRLLRALAGRLRTAGPATGLQRHMLELLDTLADEAPAAAAGQAVATSHPPGSRRWAELELPRLRFEWQAGMAASTLESAPARAAWAALVRHDAPWLRELMLRQVQHQRARAHMAQGLPPALLAELADLFVAGAGVFVQTAVEHTAQLAPPSRAGAARQRLWSFSLAWLAAERGSEFNKRSYMDSLLRNMARTEGMDHVELLRMLATGLRSLPASGAIQRQMLRLIEDLLEVQAQAGAADAPARAGAAAGLEWLAEALAPGAVPPAGEAAQWIARTDAAFAALGAGGIAATAAARAALEEALDTPQAAARLAALLPPRLLVRVLALLRPTEHAAALRTAELIASAALAASHAGSGAGGRGGGRNGGGARVSQSRMKELTWLFLLEYLVVQGRAFAPADFARRMADWLAARLRPADPARWRRALAREAARSPRSASQALGRAVADAIVQTVAQAAASPASTPASAPKDKPPPRAAKPPPVPDPGEPIYVANAGMVLAEPFLPRLFALRGLLADDGKSFKDAVAAAKAAHLLQALVLGEAARGGSPEHELVLNKLMCGLRIADPLEWEGELAAEDLSVVDSLLGAMLQQWKVLGSTTVAGLRETFLRREGRLLCNDDHWLLVVEAGPFDMLVDQVPWGFSTIRFPWMERMIHVQWR